MIVYNNINSSKQKKSKLSWARHHRKTNVEWQEKKSPIHGTSSMKSYGPIVISFILHHSYHHMDRSLLPFLTWIFFFSTFLRFPIWWTFSEANEQQERAKGKEVHLQKSWNINNNKRIMDGSEWFGSRHPDIWNHRSKSSIIGKMNED